MVKWYTDSKGRSGTNASSKEKHVAKSKGKRCTSMVVALQLLNCIYYKLVLQGEVQIIFQPYVFQALKIEKVIQYSDGTGQES